MRKGKHLRKILLLCWAVLMPVQLAVAQSALQKRVSVNLNSVTINKLFDEVYIFVYYHMSVLMQQIQDFK